MTSARAGGPPMSREGADHALRRRREERDRISGELLDLESHTTFQLLKSTALRGRTAERWAGGRDMARLWALYSAYRTTLERAERVHARSRKPNVTDRAELTVLLAGPSVRPEAEERPVEQRSLRPRDEVLTLDETVNQMDVAFRAVARTVADVDHVWSVLLPRLADAERAHRAAEESLRKLAEPAPGADLEQLGRRLARLRADVTGDPLGATTAGAELDRATAALDAHRAGLDEALALKETYGQRRGALAARIEALRAAETGAGQARDLVTERIAAPAPPEHQAQAAALAQTLAALDAPGGRWLERAGRLARLEQAVDGAADRARSVTAASYALLDRRDELRGRLRSYQAKAVRLGRAEDPAAARHHARARDLLTTAPCDLRQAEAAVTAYRHAIQGAARHVDPNQHVDSNQGGRG